MITAAKRRLAELESRMTNDIDAWRRFAADLAEIKKEKLFIPEYADFDSYCMERWKIGSRDAARKISAGRLALKIDPAAEVFGGERQVRAFAEAQRTTVPRLARDLDAMDAQELEDFRDKAERQFTDPIVIAERKFTELHDRTMGLVSRLRKATARYGHGRQIGKLCDRIEEFIAAEEFSADRAA